MKDQPATAPRDFTRLSRPDNLPDDIANQIRERILNGTLAMG